MNTSAGFVYALLRWYCTRYSHRQITCHICVYVAARQSLGGRVCLYIIVCLRNSEDSWKERPFNLYVKWFYGNEFRSSGCDGIMSCVSQGHRRWYFRLKLFKMSLYVKTSSKVEYTNVAHVLRHVCTLGKYMSSADDQPTSNLHCTDGIFFFRSNFINGNWGRICAYK